MRELRADQVLSLGSLVTEMGERELHDTTLTNLGVLAHLGTLTDWSPKKASFLKSDFYMLVSVCRMFLFFFQMRAIITGVMRKRRRKVEELAAVDLATFGHLICGLYPSEMKRLSPYNLRSASCFYWASSCTTFNYRCKKLWQKRVNLIYWEWLRMIKYVREMASKLRHT